MTLSDTTFPICQATLTLPSRARKLIIPFDILSLPRRRLENQRNAILVHTGDPGSGKSYADLYMAEQLDPDFGIDQVCFGRDDFLEVFPELRKGQILLYEEAGAEFGARDAMTGQNKELSKILQVYRFKQIPTIFNLPHLSMLDRNGRRMMNYWVKSEYVDFAEDVGVGVWYVIKPDDWEDEIKRYKVRLRDANTGLFARLDHVKFPKPSPRLITEYEKRKSEYFSNLFGGYYERSQGRIARLQKKQQASAELTLGGTPDIALREFIKSLRSDD